MEEFKPHEVSHEETPENKEKITRFAETHLAGLLKGEEKYLREAGGGEYIHQKYVVGKEMPPFEEWQEEYLAKQKQETGEEEE